MSIKTNLVIEIKGSEKQIFINRKGHYFKNDKKKKIYIEIPFIKTAINLDDYGLCFIKVKKQP